MAGQICLKCSLEIGKWGSRAKISTNWLAEKHTWWDSKEKANLGMSRRLKSSFNCIAKTNQIFVSASPVPNLCLFHQFHGYTHPPDAPLLSVNCPWRSASSCHEREWLPPDPLPTEEATPLSLRREVASMDYIVRSELSVWRVSGSFKHLISPIQWLSRGNTFKLPLKNGLAEDTEMSKE